MTSIEKFFSLLEKYSSAELLPGEEIELAEMIKSGRYREWLDLDVMEKLQADYPDLLVMPAHRTATMMNDILSPGTAGDQNAEGVPDSGNVATRVRRRWNFAYAAAAALVLTVGGVFYLVSRPAGEPEITKIPAPAVGQEDITPGGNRAILTLADGTRIVLDSAANGQLAEQPGVTITKTALGQLTYNMSGRPDGEAGDVLFNTMSTPRGGQYQLRLPDGTRVWLNAASSITYPTVFSAGERKVTIEGEVYLEVEKDPRRPFYVIVNNINIEVLGTHFNVNAYPDEQSIRTTLLEGALLVKKEGSSQTLSPGQQVQSAGTGKLTLLSGVDMTAVVAWKNGYFSFEQTDLQTILRQISRWYNVDVEYEGRIKERRFGGEVSMKTNLSEVLKILEKSKVSCRIEGNKIIVKS